MPQEKNEVVPVPFDDVERQYTPEAFPLGLSADMAIQSEIASIQASVMIAKRYPRSYGGAQDRILEACQRPALAEVATYNYARGGTQITGPTIRLAEELARAWGNLNFGFQVLQTEGTRSFVRAYCWDKEANNVAERVFPVNHRRFTKKGTYDLQDDRDIYELIANQAQRRVRACILQMIPGEMVDMALEACETTMRIDKPITKQSIDMMVTRFADYGVTLPMIEAKIQRRLDTTVSPGQMVGLRKIFNSLKDGASKAADWFEVEAKEEKPKAGMAGVKEALKKEDKE